MKSELLIDSMIESLQTAALPAMVDEIQTDIK